MHDRGLSSVREIESCEGLMKEPLIYWHVVFRGCCSDGDFLVLVESWVPESVTVNPLRSNSKKKKKTNKQKNKNKENVKYNYRFISMFSNYSNEI